MKILSTALIALTLAAGPALAQTSVFRTANAATGQSTRVATITALKRDCSVGQLSEVKVVTAPKSGSLVVRSAKLKTPANFRCPNVETPVHGIFYQSNANFTGTDEIAYEAKSADGNVQRFNVKIEVGKTAPTPAPDKAKPAPGGKVLEEL